jgi:hypothetical protein
MIPKDEKAKQFAIMACTPFRPFPTDGSHFPYVGKLNEDDTVESIIRKFHAIVSATGEKHGKYQKEQEIKKVLGIIEED